MQRDALARDEVDETYSRALPLSYGETSRHLVETAPV